MTAEVAVAPANWIPVTVSSVVNAAVVVYPAEPEGLWVAHREKSTEKIGNERTKTFWNAMSLSLK